MAGESGIGGRPKELDSPLRGAAQGLLNASSDSIVDRFPNVTANKVSSTGTGLVIGGAIILAAENRRLLRRKGRVAVGAGMMGIGYALDGFDGSVKAAHGRRANKNGTTMLPDRIPGEVVDYGNDRFQEVLSAGVRALTARGRGSRLGESAAQGVELSTVLPSMVKLQRRARDGVAVHETGHGLLAMIGSRPGRAVLSVLGSTLPSAQQYIDLLGVAGNAQSYMQRRIYEGQKVYSDNERRIAKTALDVGGVIHAGAIAHVLYSRARRGEAGRGLMMATSAALPALIALKGQSVITTEQLQEVQRLIPHDKWGARQPVYRDALRYLSRSVSGAEGGSLDDSVKKAYPELESEADRIKDAIENKEYEGKVVVVTGSTGAIGQALVKQMALLGADVVMCARDVEKAVDVRQQIVEDLDIDMSKIHIYHVDLSDQNSVVGAVEELREKFDGIDIVVNNAGYTPAKYEEKGETPISIAEVNHLGPTILTLGLLPYLNAGGQVVDITSSSQKAHAEDFEDNRLPQAGTKPKKDQLKRVYYNLKLASEAVRNALMEDLKVQGDERGIRFVAFHPSNVHKVLEGNSIKSRASRSEVVRPLLASADEAALGVVRVLLTTEGDGKYAYGKLVDFPEAAKSAGFQQRVINATEAPLVSRARELVGPQLERLKA